MKKEKESTVSACFVGTVFVVIVPLAAVAGFLVGSLFGVRAPTPYTKNAHPFNNQLIYITKYYEGSKRTNIEFCYQLPLLDGCNIPLYGYGITHSHRHFNLQRGDTMRKTVLLYYDRGMIGINSVDFSDYAIK